MNYGNLETQEIMKIKRKRIWVNKTTSFKEAEEFDIQYYLAMPRSEKIETIQFLRENVGKIKKRIKNAHRKGLLRTVKVIQQIQG